MIKGMKKDGYWYKIKDLSKIKKSDYIKFEVTTAKLDDLMKVLKPNQTKKPPIKSKKTSSS